MSNYSDFIDLVLVRFDEVEGKVHLFQAPPFTHLSHGDEVRCDFFGGEIGMVVDSGTYLKKSDELRFILALVGAGELRRVLSKVEYRAMDYDDEEVEKDE